MKQIFQSECSRIRLGPSNCPPVLRLGELQRLKGMAFLTIDNTVAVDTFQLNSKITKKTGSIEGMIFVHLNLSPFILASDTNELLQLLDCFQDAVLGANLLAQASRSFFD